MDGVEVESYQAAPQDSVYFGPGDDYTDLAGVVSFRGDNYRRNPYYGTAKNVVEKKLEAVWYVGTGSLGKGSGGSYSGSWTGSGWSGQPIIVQWPESTKKIMNMYDSAKAKAGLVEVIYATMDGKVYFLDAQTGDKTRDPVNIGVPFKGAGSLDPRGIPVLYLGSGDHYDESGRESRAMALSLVTGKVLFSFGNKDDSFSDRAWHAYDSSALVDAKSDTLIYPGENGIIYRVKLNTQYDEAAGTLTMNPGKPVKFRYGADRTGENDYWVGYEGSAVGWREYGFFTENSGLMHCVNLNTMETVWVQDIWDDTNATAAFEEDVENTAAYLYVGNTLDNKADSNGHGPIAFFKIDATTGEIVWQREFQIYTTKNVTGGLMSSPVLGQGNLAGMVFTTVASYGGDDRGIIYALDTKTGNTLWEYDMGNYAWSSPVMLYDEAGNGYLVQCNRKGNVYLLNGKTGEVLDMINIESNIEASPAAFDNMIVVGTRGQRIYGIKLK
ncbi:MAG: pyrrolo-quinoline quinone [Clostridiales bacterium]|nr:pyrrolo-quinoline quinone [Clostridiales bacterium]